jgi:hypothetical protein
MTLLRYVAVKDPWSVTHISESKISRLTVIFTYVSLITTGDDIIVVNGWYSRPVKISCNFDEQKIEVAIRLYVISVRKKILARLWIKGRAPDRPPCERSDRSRRKN